MKCIDRNSKEMCLLSLGALTHFISLGGDRQGWTRAGNEIISRREICKTLHCTVYSTVTTCVVLVTHRCHASCHVPAESYSKQQDSPRDGRGAAPGGPGHQHHEGQRGQDHGEGRQAAGPGDQGGAAAGGLTAVPGEE